MLREWFVKLRRFLNRENPLDDLHREMESHLQLEIDDGADAVKARRRFGNRTNIAERTYESAGFPRLESLLDDVRYGLRSLARNPSFTAAALLSLALGIGANTAIFSVLDALVLRPLPVHEPERLVMLSTPANADFGFPSAFFEYFQHLASCDSVAAIYTTDRSGIKWQGAVEPLPITVGLISPTYFATLGIEPALGRLPDDTAPTAVVSDRYWQQRFAGSADIAGRAFTLNGVSYTVTGVMPRGFFGDTPGKPVDIWIPLAMQQQSLSESKDGRAPFLRVIARLKPGVSAAQVQPAAEVAYLNAIGEELPERAQAGWRRDHVRVDSAARGFSNLRRTFATPLTILMAAVGLVLLIACANIANLLLARSTARRREIGIRMALGAGRARIVRQLMTENLLLAAIGGLIGIAFVPWSAGALVKFAGSGLVPVWLDTHADLRLLFFTAGLCIATAVLFGLAPAWRAATNRWSTRVRSGRVLVAVQIALSLTMLIAAGLLVRSLGNLKSQDIGFSREHVLLVWTAPEQAGRDARATARLFRAVPERLSTLPGVVSASASLIGLLEGGYAPSNGLPAPNLVTPGFFATSGMRLLAGRDFSTPDTDTSTPVGVVNETLARQQFGDVNPIGKRFRFRRTDVEIIGLVSDAIVNTLREGKRPMLFIPYTQDASHLFSMCVAVRLTTDSPAMPGLIREAIRDVDRELPVVKIDTMAEQIDQSLVEDRVVALLSSAFGILALILTIVGLYGVMSYATARRAAEFGVRMALGATRAQLFQMVMSESLSLVIAGVALGLPCAYAVGTLLRSRLFGVKPADAYSVIGAVAGILLLSLLAALIPARRATRVDPAVTLRWE